MICNVQKRIITKQQKYEITLKKGLLDLITTLMHKQWSIQIDLETY